MSRETDIESMSTIVNKLLVAVDELETLNKRVKLYDGFDSAIEEVQTFLEEIASELDEDSDDDEDMEIDDDDIDDDD